MSKKHLAFILAAHISLLAAGTTVVIPDQPSVQEKFAAQELSEHLKKITCSEAPIVREAEFSGTKPVIYLGRTKPGASAAKGLVRPEQWLIKSLGKDSLLLTGSDPRGVMYSVYSFLDRFCGVRWFDEKNSRIPENRNFKLPETELSGYPAFRTRFIYDTLDHIGDSRVFKIRNKGLTYRSGSAVEYPLIGSPSIHHTFHNYADKFPVRKPEMFALREGEKRSIESGQLCMTNPDTRKYVLQALKDFIAADREKAKKEGVPAPVIYDISANDNPNFCQCPSCKEIAEREGNVYSAPQLDFINFIAREIRKDYPDVFIRTFAYLYSYNPPSAMKAEQNVIIHLAMLGSEFGGNGIRNTMRPLTHPDNAKALQLIKKWGECAKNVAVWDYWKLFGSDHSSLPSAYVNTDAITESFPIYCQNNVRDLFVEMESPESLSFFGLRRWLGYRLMEDPSRDPKAEIADFMQGMYGKAAPAMRKYLDFLSEEQDKVSYPLGTVSVNLREYFNGEYFRKAFALLDEASSIAENSNDRRSLSNIEREYVPLYATLIRRYPRFTEEEQKLFDFEKILTAYEKRVIESIDYYYPKQGDRRNLNAVLKQKLQRELFIFREAKKQLPVPQEFSGKKVKVIPYYKFKQKGVQLITDPDSHYGKAVSLGKEFPAKTKNGRTGFGVWDTNRKCQLCSISLKNEDLPQDEKYHIVRVGKILLRNSSPYFWGTSTWLIQCVLEEFYEPTASKEDNIYDVYMSVKFSGKQYVPNSTKEDRIAIDAVYLVQ